MPTIILTEEAYHITDTLTLDSGNTYYVVSSNGAEIRDKSNNAVIYSNYIDDKCIKDIKSILKEFDVIVEVNIIGKSYIERKNYNKIKMGNVPGRNKTDIMRNRVPVMGVLQLFDIHYSRIEKITIFSPRKEVINEVYEDLSGLTDIFSKRRDEYNVEIYAEKNIKEQAIKWLRKLFSSDDRNEIIRYGINSEGAKRHRTDFSRKASDLLNRHHCRSPINIGPDGNITINSHQ